MRCEIIQSRGLVSKNVVYELGDEYAPSWMRDIRKMELDDRVVDLEPSCVPLVAVGRSISHHLRTCGLLDGYNVETARLGHGTVSYACKVNMDIKQGDEKFKVYVEMCFRFRNPSVTSVLGLSEKNIVDYIYERVVNSKGTMDSIAMRFRYLLVLQSVECYVNNLLVQL